MQVIIPVPRAEAERLYPELRGQKIWGEQEEYSHKECKDIWWVVFGPVEIRALAQATRMFKGVKVVSL